MAVISYIQMIHLSLHSSGCSRAGRHCGVFTLLYSEFILFIWTYSSFRAQISHYPVIQVLASHERLASMRRPSSKLSGAEWMQAMTQPLLHMSHANHAMWVCVKIVRAFPWSCLSTKLNKYNFSWKGSSKFGLPFHAQIPNQGFSLNRLDSFAVGSSTKTSPDVPTHKRRVGLTTMWTSGAKQHKYGGKHFFAAPPFSICKGWVAGLQESLSTERASWDGANSISRLSESKRCVQPGVSFASRRVGPNLGLPPCARGPCRCTVPQGPPSAQVPGAGVQRPVDAGTPGAGDLGGTPSLQDHGRHGWTKNMLSFCGGSTK